MHTTAFFHPSLPASKRHESLSGMHGGSRHTPDLGAVALAEVLDVFEHAVECAGEQDVVFLFSHRQSQPQLYAQTYLEKRTLYIVRTMKSSVLCWCGQSKSSNQQREERTCASGRRIKHLTKGISLVQKVVRITSSGRVCPNQSASAAAQSQTRKTNSHRICVNSRSLRIAHICSSFSGTGQSSTRLPCDSSTRLTVLNLLGCLLGMFP